MDHADGDLTTALSRADALLASPESDQDVAFAHTARVYLLSDLGREAEAKDAARALATVAPGSIDAQVAHDFLEMPYRAAAEASESRLAMVQEAGTVEGVYPNPATREVTVAFSLADEATVEVTVYDVLGRQVISSSADHPAGTGHQSLDISVLAPGTYVVRVQANEDVTTHRLTVAR